MRRRTACAMVLSAALALQTAFPLQGLDKKKIPFIPAAKPSPPEEALHAYIERVRAQQAAEVKTPGSMSSRLWSPKPW
jgi:hypothetical protein